jgi:hypothetical protein
MAGRKHGLVSIWNLHSNTIKRNNLTNVLRIILGFAVVTPMTSSLTMAFMRCERALLEISRVRSFSFQIYMAHALWDWDPLGRAGSTVNCWCIVTRSWRNYDSGHWR